MSDMDDMFLDSFTRLLDDVSDIAAVRLAQQSGDRRAMWTALHESGFVDALLPEADGGAGFDRSDVVPLLMASGERLVPVAFGPTMVARMLAAGAGCRLPVDGPVTLWPVNDRGALRSQVAPPAVEADFALVQQGTQFRLLPMTASGERDGFGIISGSVDLTAVPLLQFSAEGVDLLDWAAALTSVAMAGAMSRTLAMCLQHVMDRQQFGRPLGNFQVIQHLIAQTAEQTVLAGAGARIAFSGHGCTLDGPRAAVGKSLTSVAAGEVSHVAHAVFGAIGISEEHDLQLYTRHLKRLQLSYGSHSYWARRLGDARLASPQGTSVDFIRGALSPQAAAS